MGGLSRITVELDPDAWHGQSTEGLWADEVANGRYRIRNIPFYARGLSFGDVVFVRLESTGRPVVEGVSLRGGHSTYRLFLAVDAKDERFVNRWAQLDALGCSYEGVSGELLAVDVPPAADIYEVYDLLQSGEDDGMWEFEEGHCGHPLKEAPESGAP